MKRKFYIAFTLEHTSCAPFLTQYKEIRKHLAFFFDFPKYDESIDTPYVTILPPFEATMQDIGNIYMLLTQEKRLVKGWALRHADFITLVKDGKSFGYKLNPNSVAEELIDKICTIVKPMHITVSKTLPQILETLHLTLIKKVADEALFEKGRRYIEIHYPPPPVYTRNLLSVGIKIFIWEKEQWNEWFTFNEKESLSV